MEIIDVLFDSNPNLKGKYCIDFAWQDYSQGVIVKLPTGIVFTNQVGGMSCDHPYCEGVFIPISSRDDLVKELKFIKNESSIPEHLISMAGNHKDVILKLLNEKFEELELPFVVLESRKYDIAEAWIPVVIDNKALRSDCFLANFFSQFEGCVGYLIYGNSD